MPNFYMHLKRRHLGKEPAVPIMLRYARNGIYRALYDTRLTVQELTNMEGGSEGDILDLRDFESLALSGGLAFLSQRPYIQYP